MLTPRRIESERAFTLIEMLIAMVLITALLVVFSTVFIKSFSQSSKSREERQAVESARSAFSQFSRDIRDARSPDRDAQFVGNASELSGALLQDKQLVLRVPSSPTPITLDVRDVVEATDTSFSFRMDADSGAGFECIRYWVRPSDKAFVRSVLRYNSATRTCVTNAPLSEKVLMEQVQ